LVFPRDSVSLGSITALDDALIYEGKHLQPGLLLIGIDPETHQVLVWSGRQATATAAADLLQMIAGGRAGVEAPAYC